MNDPLPAADKLARACNELMMCKPSGQLIVTTTMTSHSLAGCTVRCSTRPGLPYRDDPDSLFRRLDLELNFTVGPWFSRSHLRDLILRPGDSNISSRADDGTRWLVLGMESLPHTDLEKLYRIRTAGFLRNTRTPVNRLGLLLMHRGAVLWDICPERLCDTPEKRGKWERAAIRNLRKTLAERMRKRLLNPAPAMKLKPKH